MVSASLDIGLAACDCSSLFLTGNSVFFALAQTRMNVPKTMVAASMNVSTPLGATYASAEMASSCMKITMTVKKVSPLFRAFRKDELPQTLSEPECFLPYIGKVCTYQSGTLKMSQVAEELSSKSNKRSQELGFGWIDFPVWPFICPWGWTG